MVLSRATRFWWIVVAAVALGWGFCAEARVGEPAPAHATRVASTGELPTEARETLARIQQGGPYPYQRDGIVFNNYERLLPSRPRGYYREYTVPEPSGRGRGPRRLIVGCARESGRNAERSKIPDCSGPVEIYYTEDHYRSFRRVKP
ncbi:MAG TPA: ribonuclease domain-containing protein [Burkholderiales bacterium]|nr:ribonuclease domain-containing protein [Burkholderiales bacterium]